MGFHVSSRGQRRQFYLTSGATLFLEIWSKLKMSPGSIGVASHNHPDHIGGIFHFLKKNNNVIVYIPQSFPEFFKNNLKNAGVTYVDIQNPLKFFENGYSTGEMDTEPGKCTRDKDG